MRPPGFESLALRHHFPTSEGHFGLSIGGPDLSPNISSISLSRHTVATRKKFVRDFTYPPISGPMNTHTNECSHCNEWLTVDQVCKQAHIGRTYLYVRWAAGDGPRFSQVGGKRLVRADWLGDWLLMAEVA